MKYASGGTRKFHMGFQDILEGWCVIEMSVGLLTYPKNNTKIEP